MTTKGLFVSLLVAGGFFSAMAQGVTFTTNVDPGKVAAGAQVEVAFILNGASLSDNDKFKAPDFGQFVIMSGPISSTNVQFVNGRMTSSVSFTYFLYARQPGKYTIGSASIEYKGSVLKTDPVPLEVTQAGTGGSQTQKQKQQDQQPVTTQELGDNLFLRASLNKTRVRQGEQFIVTYKIYTRLNIENFAVSKAPTYEGFWAEDFDQEKNPAVATETINGKQYRTAALKRTALFATQPGSLKISPLEVRCAVQLQARRRANDPFDIFNDPFFNRFKTEEADIKSNPLTITVDPLPGTPPATFDGAAGKYTFTVGVDRRETRTGEPISLKLIVAGTGNIKLISIPKPDFPADIETYEPKTTEEISREGNVIRGRKVAEYLLIPRNAGDRTVEPVTFSYFDLEKGTYVSLRSNRFDLKIAPGKEIAGSGLSGASKEDVRLLGEDIRFVKLNPGTLRSLDRSPIQSGWFLGGIAVPPLAFIGALLYRRRQDRLSGNVTLIRFQKAGREAAKRLKSAQKILAAGNEEAYHAEVSRALFGYLSDKLHLSPASLTLENVLATLQQRGVAGETIHRLRSCIERAEFARFAPGADSQAARKDLLDAATQAINGVEQALSSRS